MNAGFGILPLSIPIFMVVGIVVLAAHRKWGWLALSCLTVMVAAVLLFFGRATMVHGPVTIQSYSYSGPQPWVQPPSPVKMPVIPQEPAAVVVVPEISSPVVPPSISISTDGFPADVYPSISSAAKGLALRILPALEVQPQRKVLLDEGDVDGKLEGFSNSFRQALLDRLPGLEFVNAEFTQLQVEAPDVGTAPKPLRIRLEVPTLSRQKPAWSQSLVRSATLRVQITTAGKKPDVRQSVNLDEKPWVENLSTRPGQWFVFDGQGFASAPDADRAALQKAAARLFPLVRSRMGYVPPSPSRDQQWLLQQLQEDLSRSGVAAVADHFTQRFQRQYGTLYSRWILVDASEQHIGRLASLMSDRVRDRQGQRAVVITHRRTTLASIAGLSISIFAIYLLINSLTKGYFRFSLRAVAFILMMVGVLVVLMLA